MRSIYFKNGALILKNYGILGVTGFIDHLFRPVYLSKNA